tara:strand:- start:166 stop:549 length:384 start_codon:yes stop_codon:yes gene_type:complete
MEARLSPKVPHSNRIKFSSHCVANYDKEIKQLLSKSNQQNIDLNQFDDFGFTPLLYAAKHHNFLMLEYLMDAKADLAVINLSGENVLHLLLSSPHPPPSTTTISRRTPVAFAASSAAGSPGMDAGMK